MFLEKTLVSRQVARFRQNIGLRFATKEARFRLAVTAGFVIAAVGFLVVGADTKFGVAQSVWGFSLQDLGLAPVQQVYRQEPSPQYSEPKHHHKTHVARRQTDEFGDAKPVSLARQSMCVRLCDGFAFPVGDYHGDGDRAAHEATCQSECPGAQTALFVLPQGSTTIGDATEVSTGRNYSEMPEAFHYTTFVDEACSCHPRQGNRIKSLLHDFTLRRGDAVMTPKGLKIFHGGLSYPYKRRDFVALSQSRDIRKAARENLRAIERASLSAPVTYASATTPGTDALADRNGTKALQHQAKN